MKVYPSYRECGIEWINLIPSHWEVVKSKYLFRQVAIRNFADEELLSVYRDYGVVSRYSRDDNFNRASEDLSNYKLVRKGFLAINKMKTWQGSIAISNLQGIVSPAYITCEPIAEFYGKYLHYLFRSKSYIQEWHRLSQGVRPSQWDLSYEDFSQTPALFPPLPEQQAIANFLDCKTAQIDALIEKKQRQIDLLQEQRTALINHAITKGLNPDVSTKDSGLEWLGEIPSHWEGSIKLTMLSEDVRNSFVNGPFGSNLLVSELKDTGVPVIYIRDIRNGVYRRKSTEFVTSEKALELDVCRVDPGDLLIAKVGDPPGATAVYPEGEPSGIVTQDVIRIKLKSTIVAPQYLALFLNSEAGRAFIAQITIESTRSRIPLGDFKNVRIPLPPVEEQMKIIEEMSDLSFKVDKATRILHDIIEKLKEYRTALISEAVTGKIDVREWKTIHE